MQILLRGSEPSRDGDAGSPAGSWATFPALNVQDVRLQYLPAHLRFTFSA